jgi:hypothetical protein
MFLLIYDIRAWRLTTRGVEVFDKANVSPPIYAQAATACTPPFPRCTGWTVKRIREHARRIGPATCALSEQILEARPHPEHGYRIVRVAGSYRAPPPRGFRRAGISCESASSAVGKVPQRSRNAGYGKGDICPVR